MFPAMMQGRWLYCKLLVSIRAVFFKCKGNISGLTYSSGVNVARSFRSAPAQKLESTSLARINALVDPLSPSSCMLLIWWLSSASNCRDIALRAAGRFKERILMLPQ